jgi:cytochrome c oxidase cbb3-type subunit 3
MTYMLSVNGWAQTLSVDAGKRVFDYYCYQCHGYAGDAKTLAAQFLDPPPRNFNKTSLDQLSREQMVDAVAQGRVGTAMVAFSNTISTSDIKAVVDYIRDRLMQTEDSREVYHSAQNGWPNHQRYQAAFPFVLGESSLEKGRGQMTPTERRGYRLYTTACVTCHDAPGNRREKASWEARAVSYPRRHYTPRLGADAVTGATPLAKHDLLPEIADMSDLEKTGQSVYQINCAFCHAADGTGKNWIGSFLEPPPRDLTQTALVSAMDPAVLRQRIVEGLPGTSMPAWGQVLSESELEALIAYLKKAFSEPPQPG